MNKKQGNSILPRVRLYISDALSAVHTHLLLTAGMINFLAFILQDSMLYRVIMAGMFYVLAVSRKRIRISYYIVFISSIVFFYLLLPSGRVLFSLGSFRITQGALEEGLFRGITLSALVFLSLWAISPSLSLPGYVGNLLSLSLRFFSLLFDEKESKKNNLETVRKDKNIETEQQGESIHNTKTLFSKIDSLMCTILKKYYWQEKQSYIGEAKAKNSYKQNKQLPPNQALAKEGKHTVLGYVLLAMVSSMSCLLLYLSV